jgi:NAD(P)-dependent dehydrogenase (short-subunit alcohol dehydrogenase family)
MNGDLSGKGVIVTGGAGGIGRALTTRLLDQGARVAVLDLPDMLEHAIDGASRHACDVADEASVTRAVAKAADALGRVHVLVNNAGVILRSLPTAEIPPSAWSWVLGVNLMGVVNVTHHALPLIRAHGEPGHVVNIGSVSGFIIAPDRNTAAYAASKFAVTAYTEALAMDMKGLPIGVSLIAPAAVATDIYPTSASSRPEGMQGTLDNTPADTGNGLAPEAVADAILDAMRTGRFLTLTHSITRDWIAERTRRLLNERDN